MLGRSKDKLRGGGVMASKVIAEEVDDDGAKMVSITLHCGDRPSRTWGKFATEALTIACMTGRAMRVELNDWVWSLDTRQLKSGTTLAERGRELADKWRRDVASNTAKERKHG